MKNSIKKKLIFNDKGLIPAIIQDERSKKVLTLCYMNREALKKTIKEGRIYVFRRSANKLMMKGQSSGNIQIVKKIYADCENKSLLFLVKQKVAACHKGYFTCYFSNIKRNGIFRIEGKRVFHPNKVYKKG